LNEFLREQRDLAAGERWRNRIASLLPFAIVALVYAAVASYQIQLPGLYMDAVDPDYLAVRILNWHRNPFVPWVLPGNDLFGHFPVLTSLYYGIQQLYLPLPVFWLLGTTVTSLRVAHALFALFILATLYVLLVKGTTNRWWTAGICTALALDPGFVFAFRTQSYITMAPVAWLLLSVSCLQQRAKASPPAALRLLTMSGFFFGLSVFGYFVYAFYSPPLAIVAIVWRSHRERRDVRAMVLNLASWCVGVLAGCVGYVFGYSLLAESQGGFRGLLTFTLQYQQNVGAFSAHQSLWGRLLSAWQFIESVFYNWWHNALMFGDYTPIPGAAWKTALLLGLPLLLWAIAESRQRAVPLLRVVLALELSFFLVALVFGDRLGGHHFVSLLPLSYAALALAVQAIATAARQPVTAAGNALAWVIVVLLLSINLAGEKRESDQLRATHGIGLYSDAINHLAADLLKSGQQNVVFLPDWGLFMPVAFLTGGNVDLVTDEDYALARQTLCKDRPVAVALIKEDRRARFSRWRTELGVAPTSLIDYRQFDGKVVFQLATFTRASPTSECAP
jgi:hypothetical protein